MLFALLISVFSISVQFAAAAEPFSCEKNPLGPPLNGSLRVISAFDPTGKSGRPHRGVDFAGKGGDVLAVAEGTIKKIGWDYRSISSDDARTGLKVVGWGRYVIVGHSDGSEALYAHLNKDSTKGLSIGTIIKRGEKFAQSDNTGAVTAPHLHLEYAPFGDVIKTKRKVDPNKCIARSGTITLYSMTETAAGAFRLSLNGKELGRVAFEERKSFPVSGLLPGKVYKLLLEALETRTGEAAYGIEFSDNDDIGFVNKRKQITGPAFYSALRKGAKIELLIAVTN